MNKCVIFVWYNSLLKTAQNYTSSKGSKIIIIINDDDDDDNYNNNNIHFTLKAQQFWKNFIKMSITSSFPLFL
jgi:hypothetical protein